MTEFGKQVRKALIDANLNQTKLAERLGISSAQISMMLSGKRPIKSSFVEQLAQLGMLDFDMRVACVRQCGRLDVSDLTHEQLSDLMRLADLMRGQKP